MSTLTGLGGLDPALWLCYDLGSYVACQTKTEKTLLNHRTWEAALGTLQVEVPKADFLAWFRDTAFVRAAENSLVVSVPTVFAKETVERKYREHISRALARAHGSNVGVTFVVQAAPAVPLPASPVTVTPSSASLPRTKGVRLNPKYTFDRFIVGDSNRLAYAAAIRATESPGTAFNPLFFYSGVGLGKTHLLHAIGHALASNSPEMNLRYVPCETFVNELLFAIRTDDRGDRRRRFRERYRNVDALLIDDVEFLSRTEASQEELFHTFNALYESGRQIVLTSDQPPSEIPRLAARLRSRFEAGLVADIQAPDVDLRRALLEAQARNSGTDVPDRVVDFLADRVRRNVRELEGALTRTLIYCELHGLALSPETAALALDGLGRSTSDRPPKPREIMTAVATHFEVPPDDLVGKRRDARTAGARQVAMYLLRNDGRETFPEIGRLLGGRDHSTILHGCGKIARRLKIENRLKTDLAAIRAFVAAHP